MSLTDFVFIDRNDTTRMFSSGYVTPDPEVTDPLHALVEPAYRSAPGASAPKESRCEVKRAMKGVYFLTVFNEMTQPPNYLIAVARTINV